MDLGVFTPVVTGRQHLTRCSAVMAAFYMRDKGGWVASREGLPMIFRENGPGKKSGNTV